MIVRAGSKPPINWATTSISSIVDHLGNHGVVSTPSGTSQSRGFVEFAYDGLFQPERTPGVPGGTIAKVQQQPSNARPDGPQSDNSLLWSFP